MTRQQALMTPNEVKALRDLCTGWQMEMGSMLGPEHLRCMSELHTQRFVTKSGRTTILFPTDQSADKWNRAMETRIRRTGHAATAVVTVLVTVTTSGLGGIVAGTAAGIVKDEAQAMIPYAYARRAWRIELDHRLTYEQNPLGTDRLRFEYTTTGTDHAGVRQYRTEWQGDVPVGEMHGQIPRDVAVAILSRAGNRTTKVFH